MQQIATGCKILKHHSYGQKYFQMQIVHMNTALDSWKRSKDTNVWKITEMSQRAGKPCNNLLL